MSLSDLASLGSFISGVAVLASLVFLFFQMRQMTEQVRQAEKNQQAVIRQGRANALMELDLRLTDPTLSDVIVPTLRSEPVGNILQLNQFLFFLAALLHHLQDNFDQHREGLLNEKDFEVFVRSTSAVVPSAAFRVAWRTMKANFGDDFASFMDRFIARTPLVKGSDPAAMVAQFNHDVQAELMSAG